MSKFNVEQLKYEAERKNYTEEIKKELNTNKSSSRRQWEAIRDTIIITTKNTVGISKSQTMKWYNVE